MDTLNVYIVTTLYLILGHQMLPNNDGRAVGVQEDVFYQFALHSTTPN